MPWNPPGRLRAVLLVVLMSLIPALAVAAPGPARPLGKGVCRPDCRGRTCGSDGCGGSCGQCKRGSGCLKHRCVKAPAGDPCVAMTGHWTGVMPATGRHTAEYLSGRIWGTAKACRAELQVTYSPGAGSKVKVIEHFKITLWGPKTRLRARFVCTKVTPVTPGISYNADTFLGTLNLTLTRFRGSVRDTAGATSPVRLNKK